MTTRAEDHNDRKRQKLPCHKPCTQCTTEKAAEEYALTMRKIERLEKQLADAERERSELVELHRQLRLSVRTLTAAAVKEGW